MKVKISITLERELLEKIDKKRGLVSRSAYIEYLLRKIFEQPKKTEETVKKFATEKQIDAIMKIINELSSRASEEGQEILEKIQTILPKLERGDASDLIRALSRRDIERCKVIIKKYRE